MSDASDHNPSELEGGERLCEPVDGAREVGDGQTPADLTETIPDDRSHEQTSLPAGERAEVDTDELSAEIIDERYLVRSLLGEGSMGSVYKVYDLELEEVAALKTLHEEFVRDDTAEQRFRNEVKLARRVTHPNVARIFDLGLREDVPYLTMEFIDGEPLDVILDREGALSAGDVIDFIEPICEGLAAAHDAEVVHRDLKPQNIMVGSDRIVLTDFGIARALRRSDRFSITRGGMVGTPAYMAPEQVDADRSVDARTDIYSVGVLLYRMLTGQFPWNKSSTVAMALERCERSAPELPADGDWPDAYRDVVHRCLKRDKEDRYDEVTEVPTQLTRAGDPDFSTYVPGALETGPVLGTADSRIGRDSAGRGLGLQTPPEGKTVAVLPLEQVGPDELEYRAVGFTEELLDELSRSDGLAVLPRGAVRQYRDAPVDPRDAGRALDVEVVVEGSIRQIDGAVRVRLAAICVDDGFQIWAEQFRADPSELLDLGGRAADALRDALTLEPEERRYEPPSDARAVDLYMRARHELYERWFSDLTPAIDLFERALERAPEDPRILSGLAAARARAAFVDPEGRRTHLEEAQMIADRAIEIAPNWPQPHFALAKVHYNRVQFGRALDEVERALEIAPDFAGAHALRGRILAEIGPLETAARHLQRALELNPYAYNARWDLARVRALRGTWSRVDDLLARPVDSDLQTVLRYANRTRLDVWRESPRWLDDSPPDQLPRGSDFEKLTPIMRKVTRGEPLEDAERQTLEVALSEEDADSRYLSLQYQFRTEIAARAEAPLYALACLDRAVEAGLVDLNWLEEAPVLESLRGYSRFRDARSRVEERVRDHLDD